MSIFMFVSAVLVCGAVWFVPWVAVLTGDIELGRAWREKAEQTGERPEYAIS